MCQAKNGGNCSITVDQTVCLFRNIWRGFRRLCKVILTTVNMNIMCSRVTLYESEANDGMLLGERIDNAEFPVVYVRGQYDSGRLCWMVVMSGPLLMKPQCNQMSLEVCVETGANRMQEHLSWIKT
jgi:hypothetical protein